MAEVPDHRQATQVACSRSQQRPSGLSAEQSVSLLFGGAVLFVVAQRRRMSENGGAPRAAYVKRSRA